MPERLILKSFQSPGDTVMLTAAVRDLHNAYPGRFETDVRTSAPELWENNPHITPINESEPGVKIVDMHYPLVRQSNQRPYHFIHGFVQYLEDRLKLRIPVTEFRGDLHLSDQEKAAALATEGINLPERYWIIVAGGKYDFTAKWWNPDSYQQVVDHFQGKISFVQCGAAEHWHPPVDGVVNLIGKTGLRDLIRLLYRAEGVLCPVTLAMHLAAAVETPESIKRSRPCVVVAGGREPTHWEAYPHHQYISTQGMLDCCADGGCWKSRCQKVGDGNHKDRSDLCVEPVLVSDDLVIPRCLDMIKAEDVIRRIEMYLAQPQPMARPVVRSNGTPTQSKRQWTQAKERTARRYIVECEGGVDDVVSLGIIRTTFSTITLMPRLNSERNGIRKRSSRFLGWAVSSGD